MTLIIKQESGACAQRYTKPIQQKRPVKLHQINRLCFCRGCYETAGSYVFIRKINSIFQAPGFDFEDFELTTATDLIEKYPDRKSLIISLTRE
jgi:hypothetical protein